MLDYVPNDGYSEKGFVHGQTNIHNDFRFTFRPMLAEERAVLLSDRFKKLPEDEQEKKLAAAVASRVSDWSLVDAKGMPVPVSEAVCRRLKPALFNRVFWIIAGTDAGDVDPELAEAERHAAADVLMESAISGKAPGDVRLERDEKNSGAG